MLEPFSMDFKKLVTGILPLGLPGGYQMTKEGHDPAITLSDNLFETSLCQHIDMSSRLMMSRCLSCYTSCGLAQDGSDDYNS